MFAPIWLEEIQSNKIYKKYSERNQKLEDSKQNTTGDEDEEGTEETKLNEAVEEDKEAVQSSEETENSKTESDQDLDC